MKPLIIIAILLTVAVATLAVVTTLEIFTTSEELVVENQRLYRENFNALVALKAERQHIADLYEIQQALLNTIQTTQVSLTEILDD